MSNQMGFVQYQYMYHLNRSDYLGWVLPGTCVPRQVRLSGMSVISRNIGDQFQSNDSLPVTGLFPRGRCCWIEFWMAIVNIKLFLGGIRSPIFFLPNAKNQQNLNGMKYVAVVTFQYCLWQQLRRVDCKLNLWPMS